MRKQRRHSAGGTKAAGLALVVLLAVAVVLVFLMWRRSIPKVAESSEQSAPPATTSADKADTGLAEQQTAEVAIDRSKSAKDWSALIKMGAEAAARGRDDARAQSGGGRVHRRLVARARPRGSAPGRREAAALLTSQKDPFSNLEAHRLP